MNEAQALGAVRRQRGPSANRALTWGHKARYLQVCIALVCFASVWACFESRPVARDAGARIDQGISIDVRYGPPTKVTSEQAQHLEEAVRRRLLVPGLPPDVLQGRRIQVNLVAETELGVDAVTFPLGRAVALPADQVLEWDSVHLDRVVRHEIAHVALRAFFDGASLPVWLEEGFPEWVAGGLDCVGEARVRLAVVTNARRGLAPYRLFHSVRERPSRLAYDLYGTFLTYLEQRQPNVVASGDFLAAVRDQGIDAGVRAATGAGLEDLEVEWQRHIAEKYGSVPHDYSCR